MRNATLTAGSLAQTIAAFKTGISAVSASLDESLAPAAAHVRSASTDEFVRAMIPESLVVAAIGNKDLELVTLPRCAGHGPLLPEGEVYLKLG